MKDFKETNICMELNKIMSARQYGYDDECTLRNVGILFQGMAVYLGRAKSKDNPVAVILTDIRTISTLVHMFSILSRMIPMRVLGL